MSSGFENSPIIICGAPRSGTTYLNYILNSHPKISITHETRLFTWLHRSLNVLTQDDKALLSYRKQFIEELRSSFPSLIREFYRKVDPKARYWGDKNPHYLDDSDCLETIKSLFPGTRFIHIIRDGRDVVASLMRKGWVDFSTAHRMWGEMVDRGCEFGSKQPPDCYLELKYENLIRDDLAVAKGVFEFLRIDFHENVAQFCIEQQKNRTPLSEPTRNLNAGVAHSDWHDVFNPDQQIRSLWRLEPHLVRYGYESKFSLPPKLTDTAKTHCVDQFRELVRTTVASNAVIAVVSKGDDNLTRIEGFNCCHFPGSETGDYVGFHPADDDEAIRYLETARARGVTHLVFPAPSMWWLSHYVQFSNYLDERYSRQAHVADTLAVFDLRASGTS